LSHIFLTEALTFIVTILQKYSESTGVNKLPNNKVFGKSEIVNDLHQLFIKLETKFYKNFSLAIETGADYTQLKLNIRLYFIHFSLKFQEIQI
jgi:hypothetical protein